MPAKARTRLPASAATEASIGLQMRRQHLPVARGDCGGDCLCRVSLADHDQRVGARELRRQRRAQGTCGEHVAVADAALAVDHDQRGILGDRRILKTVIHQDDAGALRFRHRHAR